jgi:hypothetical protein
MGAHLAVHPREVKVRKRIIGLLVLVVAALALSASLASAAVNGYTMSLTITPSVGPNGTSVTWSGNYAVDGEGESGYSVEWYRWSDADCSGEPEASGFLTTTDSNGDYSYTEPQELPAGAWSFGTVAGSEEYATSPCREFISGAAAVAVAPPPTDHMYLCYSKWEQDGGILIDAKDAAADMKAGMWAPFAVKGDLPDGSGVENMGAYHLSCNPDPSLKPTGGYIDNIGEQWDAPPTQSTPASSASTRSSPRTAGGRRRIPDVSPFVARRILRPPVYFSSLSASGVQFPAPTGESRAR